MDQSGKRLGGEVLKLQWRARLERFAGAKQSVRAFCAAEAVSESTFFHWRRRLSGQGEVAPSRVRVREKAAGFVDAGVARARAAPVPMPGSSLPAPLGGGLEVQIDLGAGVLLRILRR